MKTQKQSAVREKFGTFAPGYVEYSETVLFGDLWNRQGLTARDRSLITLVSLISSNNFKQIPFHLRLAEKNGLTQSEVVEAITHVCFYAGWPKADTALSIAKDFFKTE